jgi:two-component system sensor histidine kinase QseC
MMPGTEPEPHARSQSLRWRLLRAVFATALLVWGLNAILSYTQARHEAEELMDGHLAQAARLLLALVRDNESHLEDLAARLATVRSQERHRYESPLEFQVGRADGSLLLRSAQAPAKSLAAAPGYDDLTHAGHPWRVLTIASTSGDYRVQVAQSIDLRDHTALEVARRTVLPIALISPVLLLLLYYSVRRALKPLDELATDVASRSPENLRPLAQNTAPLEARPLVSALNRLFGRLDDTLANERRFTADAAHELRTPLAVVRIQAQVAQLSRNADDRQHALQQILLGADRATRVLEQLLRLARLDPLDGLPHPAEVDLAELAERVLSDARHAAADRCIVLERSDDPLLPQWRRRIAGHRAAQSARQRAALHPARDDDPRYCRATGWRVDVRRHRRRPRRPAAELPRLVERFYRGSAARAEGSGLGLAIAQRVAELPRPPVSNWKTCPAGDSPRTCAGRDRQQPEPQRIARLVTDTG